MTDTDPHYLVALRLPASRRLEVGALGDVTFPAGRYVYVGRASRGFVARLERHRRRTDKSIRWHVDYLRAEAEWLEARTPVADSECALVERLVADGGGERFVDGFGASDCGCAGHLVRWEAPLDDLPGPVWGGR